MGDPLTTVPDDESEDNLIEGSKKSILEAAGRCRNCNYCFSVCPIFQSTRGFMTQAPSGILQSLSYAIKWDLIKGEEKEILRDLVYACRTCNACVLRCKSKATGIAVLEAIQAGRKILREMMVGPMPQQRKPLKDLLLHGNPYGEKKEKRTEWVADLKVKRLPAQKAEVLLYVGCTIAYDPPLHKLGRSLVTVLEALDVDFGILENEICCGDPALRMGDEALFRELAHKNVEAFKAAGVKTIVTASPHCFTTFLKEYPSLKEQFVIEHYTEFLMKRLQERKPVLAKNPGTTVAYHDGCYLAKHNSILSSPRELLGAVPGLKLVEMKARGEEGLCCGGGGGLMFTEAEAEPETKLPHTRVGQAMDAGARVLATACPWCFTMLDNAVKDLQLTDRISVMDIAEVLAASIRKQ
jgi:Fe-S oxidoreductase